MTAKRPEAYLEDLSAREIAFLVKAAESNILAYMPNDDLLIQNFIARGLVDDVPGKGLTLSETGRDAANTVLQERDCPPT